MRDIGIIASTVSADSWIEADAESCDVGYSDISILWSSPEPRSSEEKWNLSTDAD